MPLKQDYMTSFVIMTPLNGDMQPLNEQAFVISAEDLVTIPDISFSRFFNVKSIIKNMLNKIKDFILKQG